MKRLPSAVCLLSIWFSLASLARAVDWPTYRFDNTRAGRTSEPLRLPLRAAWVRTAPGVPKRAWSGPEGRTVEGKNLYDRVKFDDALHVAVVGDRVYFGSSVDHRVHCLEIGDGKEVWTFFTGAPIRLAPTVAHGRVLVGSDDGIVYCLDAEQGRLVWKFRPGPADEWLLARGEMISRWPIRTGVLVDDGIAYFGAGIFPHENVYLCAVRVADGTVLWKNDHVSHQDAGRNDLSPQGYLLSTGGHVVVPSGRSRPSAVDRQTGKLSAAGGTSLKLSSGIVAGTEALVLDGRLFTFSLGSHVAGTGEQLYVTTGSVLAKLNRKAYVAVGSKRSKVQTELRDLFRAYRAKKIGADEYKKQSAKLGEQIKAYEDVGVVWRTPCTANSTVVVAGDLVFAGGEKQVSAFETDTGKEVWKTEVDGEARGLAAAGARLFVSTTKGSVYCFADATIKAGSTAEGPHEPDANPYPQDKWTEVYMSAAADILERANVSRGFCLVLGSETGRLAYELAKRSELKIYGIEPDRNKVEAARKALSAAGLYGHRVTIHQADPSEIPYSNYFANLVVSDTLLRTGKPPGDPAVIARCLKPCGGVVCLGRPAQASGAAATPAALSAWLDGMKLADQSTRKTAGSWAILTRGALPGAGSWTHQYGEPGNTACAEDSLIKGGLGVLWFGDPGPGAMVNRHAGAVGPVSADGRLFVQGVDNVMAYDAYNGMFLWERKNPEAIRTGVFQNHNPGNLVVGGESLFVMLDARCLQLDVATGRVEATHRLPEAKDDKSYEWGYVSYQDGILYGTATRRTRIDLARARRGKATEDATEAIFAIDTKAGKHLWSHQGNSISHRTVALGPDRVFFIDSSIAPEQRAAILRQDKSELAGLTGEERVKAEERLKRADLRLAVALDARTGKKLWENPVDVTDCSKIGIGGGELTVLYKNGILLLGGANANGHYWKQFIAGEFERRRLVALSANDGYKLWAKDANYRHRPIIVGDRAIAEPWAFDLETGEQITRTHPLTGEETPWSFMRPGHHCGMNTATPNMLLFRSKFTGFYDLKSDSGTRHFAGHRLGCWINAIPANGLVVIPEASAGCVCMFSIASTIVLEPREPRRPWSIYSGVGPATPVKQLALNLGAPGDRRDAAGKLWLGYPRPASRKTTGLELALDAGVQFLPNGGYISHDGDAVEQSSAETAWVFSSAARGITRCALPLLGKQDEPATYTVRLYFADMDDSQNGRRVFDVRVQGKTILEDFDVAAAAGNQQRSLVHEIKDVEVEDVLAIEFTPKTKSPAPDQMPILNGIEAVYSEKVKR